MKIDLETLDFFYRLSDITRYNTRARAHDESVATHSYYVALFSMMLAIELGLGSAMTRAILVEALIHDTPEIRTNDITYDAKIAIPNVKKELKKYEDTFFESYFPKAERQFIPLTNVQKEVALEIVNLADILSVLQYVRREEQLGNSQISLIKRGTLFRIETSLSNIERLGVPLKGLVDVIERET